MENSIGSYSEGNSSSVRVEGIVEYTFLSGTKYKGEMKDGKFHGKGVLYFPNGGHYTTEWANGVLKNGNSNGYFSFTDGQVYIRNNWNYCNACSERRFNIEICKGMNPAGRSLHLNSEKCQLSPTLGWFDAGNGLYNPENRILYQYSGEFFKNICDDEHNWIINNCRKGVDN